MITESIEKYLLFAASNGVELAYLRLGEYYCYNDIDKMKTLRSDNKYTLYMLGEYYKKRKNYNKANEYYSISAEMLNIAAIRNLIDYYSLKSPDYEKMQYYRRKCKIAILAQSPVIVYYKGVCNQKTWYDVILNTVFDGTESEESKTRFNKLKKWIKLYNVFGKMRYNELDNQILYESRNCDIS